MTFILLADWLIWHASPTSDDLRQIRLYYTRMIVILTQEADALIWLEDNIGETYDLTMYLTCPGLAVIYHSFNISLFYNNTKYMKPI